MYGVQFKLRGYGRKTFEAKSIEALSAKWANFRDGNGIASSDIRAGGTIYRRATEEVGYMAYNGTVWHSRESWTSSPPIYSPFASAA